MDSQATTPFEKAFEKAKKLETKFQADSTTSPDLERVRLGWKVTEVRG